MRGLYIHIPFCRRKCAYCDFSSFAAGERSFLPYVRTLSLEMRRYAGIPVETLYVGGGTPSLLPPSLLADLFDAVGRSFDYADLAEITVEANPESLTGEKCAVLREKGVNRLSIGVQSFSDGELRFLGRVHTAEDVATALSAARREGFDNIGFDLMYGLPGQSLDDWRNTLRAAVGHEPAHLSLYPLTIEEGTALHRQGVAVSDETQASLYEWSMDFLESAGYGHYEISNWSRPGFECRHNLNYWHNGEYIGVGAAAASHFNGKRCRNHADIAAYAHVVRAGGRPVEDEECIDERTRMAEDMILRLRCRSGVAVSGELGERYGAAIHRMLEAALLERSGEAVRLTRQGMLLANRVFREFV